MTLSLLIFEPVFSENTQDFWVSSKKSRKLIAGIEKNCVLPRIPPTSLSLLLNFRKRSNPPVHQDLRLKGNCYCYLILLLLQNFQIS